MKKLALTLAAIIAALILFSQSPQAFKYQAVARDSLGEVLANQPVSFQISILQGSITGTAVYVETHDTTTNEQGLVNLEIGNGTFVSGDFATIGWGGDNYFLQIEMDEAGGTAFQLIGTSQLFSVPYALYAERGGVSEINDLFDSLGVKYIKCRSGKTIQFRIEGNDFYSYFKKFGKSGDKYIPKFVKNSSTEYLKLFLDWYVKGDGHITKRKSIHLVSKSEKMIDDLQEICIKLGLGCTKQDRKTHYRMETHRNKTKIAINNP